MAFKSTQVAALALLFAASVQAQSGSGVTTRYWDCCKPSCSWSGKAAVNQPVLSCDKSGTKLTDSNVKSGCDGGTAFTCTDDQPWAINDNLSYGFAAVKLSGSTESQWCCECYELTFTSGPVTGKKFVIQATNTGGDLGNNHFDLLIPGGGVGAFTNGCPAQFGSWNGGQQYGGVSSRADCDNLPAAVRPGCYWRFDWFQNADNPSVTFQKTTCPSELIAKSGCLRNDAAPPTTTTSTSSSSTRTSSSSTTTTRSSSSSTTTSTGGQTAPQWAQCGGIGYNGPTVCASPFTCHVLNDYYSQCY